MKIGPYDLPGSYIGDCRDLLRELPDECVQCVVTSPPYWGLRDYGVDGQLGLEETPTEYVQAMVAVFREVRRVLRGDGTLWLNLGDSYATCAGSVGECPGGGKQGENWKLRGKMTPPNRMPCGLAPKNLVGIPWRVAFALQADGWILRSDIIWAKPNPMPESVTDRPTKAHEYLFLLVKQPRYFYDAPLEEYARPYDDGPGFGGFANRANTKSAALTAAMPDLNRTGVGPNAKVREGRNRRSVWLVATEPYPSAHFAVFPPKLIEPCILAGSRPGDVVLDPFFGSGTTGQVAEKHGRIWLGFELNPEYKKLQDARTAQRTLPGVSA